MLPRLSEIHIGREVFITPDDKTPNPDDAQLTITGEVAKFEDGSIVVETTFSRLPRTNDTYRLDLGGNTTTFERMDRMLDTLQRCEGPSKTQQKKDKTKLGLFLPGTPLADAIIADIDETATGALQWDPLSRQKPNSDGALSRAARAPSTHTAQYTPKTQKLNFDYKQRLNASQQRAVEMVVHDQRKLTLLQGPPGTGKTTTAAGIVVEWLKNKKGPILCCAFSNKGTDHLGACLHALGVNVVRVGTSVEPFSLDTLVEQYGGDFDSTLKYWADVVIATCVGAGMGLLRNHKFPFVVLDEAAQAVEPASLIPLSKNCVSAVLVGDQCQLPPTVISREAAAEGFGVSLFDRLLGTGMEVHMLDTQYRMHPVIAGFSSWRFYLGDLKSGVTPEDRPLPWAAGAALQKAKLLPSFERNLVFIHVHGREQRQGSSTANPEEAAAVAAIVAELRANNIQTGVVTPYSAQVHQIRGQLSRSRVDQTDVQVSSVDAFQGSERDVMVVSLVRSNDNGSLGFVSDWRRLNVAVTRAKQLCVVVCDLLTMVRSRKTRNVSITKELVGFYGPRGGGVGAAGAPAAGQFLEWDAESGGSLSQLSADVEREVMAAAKLVGDAGESANLAKLPTFKTNFMPEEENPWVAPKIEIDENASWD